jgi:hypothetical protein
MRFVRTRAKPTIPDAHQCDEGKHITGRVKGFESVLLGLPDHQQPVLLLEPRGGVEIGVAFGVFPNAGPNAVLKNRLMNAIRVPLHEASAGAATGLKYAVGVQEVGLTRLSDAHLFHQIIESLGIDGGADGPGLPIHLPL